MASPFGTLPGTYQVALVLDGPVELFFSSKFALDIFGMMHPFICATNQLNPFNKYMF